jgi:hypothetical protein
MELYKCYKCGILSHALCVAKKKECEKCHAPFHWLKQKEILKLIVKTAG